MSLESEQTVTPETSGDVAAPVAEQAVAQTETDGGSPASGEAVETRSHEQIVRDEFLAKFGPKAEAEPTPEPKVEPKAEAKVETLEESKAETKEGQSNRLTPEEIASLPEKAQRRFGELTSTVKTLRQEAEQYRESYVQLEAIRDYTAQNNLSSDDVTNGLQIMALFTNGRMKEFVDAVRPFFDQARQAIGEDVTPDLKTLVENGEMSDEAARKVSRELATARMASDAAKQAAERRQAEQQAQEAQKARDALVSNALAAIKATEATFRTDPDWSLKEPEVKRQFQATLSLLAKQKALPTTPEAYAEIARTVYEGVKVVRPEPKPADIPARATSSPAASMSTPPRTSLEAVRAAILG